MRFLILDTCYPAFLRAHYAGRPELARRPYAEQWRALMDTFFGTADSYSHALLQLGHEAHEVVTNCGPVQDAWAREAGSLRGRVRGCTQSDAAPYGQRTARACRPTSGG